MQSQRSVTVNLLSANPIKRSNTLKQFVTTILTINNSCYYMHHAIGTAQKVKFSIKDFFSECDQNRSFLWIWSHLLKKSLMENFIFCAVWSVYYLLIYSVYHLTKRKVCRIPLVCFSQFLGYIYYSAFIEMIMPFDLNHHCVKSVFVRSFSGP